MNTLKKFFVALIILTLAVMSVPTFSAYAQAGTLGTESPYLYCSYYDENGDEVDGNALTSGSYTVNVNLSGMKTAAIMQFTANYDVSSNSVINSLSVKSTYDESDSSFTLAAAEIDENQLVVILNSLNLDTCSNISEEETVIATLDVEINCNGTVDFKNYFNFETDPDLTFFMADYGDDGDCYALSQGEDVSYTVYPMTVDVTPDINNNEITISGKVLIAQDINGNVGTFGAREINFKVNGELVKDANGSNAVTSSERTHYGEFEITVSKGTTEITVTGESTVDRTVTLSGTQDISNASIPVIVCDYNKDKVINVSDYTDFREHNNSSVGDEKYAIKYNFNDDNVVNVSDYTAFKTLYPNRITYNDLSLDS